MIKSSKYLYVSLLILALTGMGCYTTTNQTSSANKSELEGGEDIIMTDDFSYDDDTIAVETEDVYGKDLTQIERYPGSIRSYYSSNDYETDVTYQTTEDVETVRQYYNEQLTAAGWTNSEEATDYMEYEKGSDTALELITVYFTEYNNGDLLEYELVYEPPFDDSAEEE